MSWLYQTRRRKPGLVARWRDLAYWLPWVVALLAAWVCLFLLGYLLWPLL